MRAADPPRLARLVLRMLAPPDVRNAVDGDLLEKYRRDLGAGASPQGSRWWYRLEVAQSAWSLVTFGLLPGAGAWLVVAILVGAIVPLAPQTLAVAFDFARQSSVPYTSLVAVNILMATLLAPVGGALAVGVASAPSLAGPAGVAVLMLVPPVLAIGLCPQAAPLWSRFVWILLVPAATLLGGSRYVRDQFSR